KIVSNGFRLFFGKILFGLGQDIQSGLKVFRRETFESVRFNPSGGWSFDLEFLHRAKEAGFKIAEHEINFDYRKEGASKIGVFKTSFEIGKNALFLRFKKIHPVLIPPVDEASMIGAGVGHGKKKYITHTTLSHKVSALQTLSFSQKIILTLLLVDIALGLIFFTLEAILVAVAILSFIYFMDVIFNLYLVLRSLHLSYEINLEEKELESQVSSHLPVYSILCPLYREADVVSQFLEAVAKLDWPKEKLDVMLLLEEDDKETIEVVSKMKLPFYVRSIVVPNSHPKTKPKACNYGLGKARGEYLVVYDAEDIPDPLQLKKAYFGFGKAGKDVICLQAKLNYYNPDHNFITRFFTAEYSLWFDITLTGLQSINTTIPLGGTSNHFRTSDLKKLQGWDPFNVTEDADLGVRLFKRGYKTAIINSTTLEEANSRFGNWLRQRSRWLKGYMQTYFVHTRELFKSAKDLGIHALIFHLVIGGKIAFILINPILWVATISYFALYAYVGEAIEALYPTPVFYMAVTSLVFGNFLFLYYYMVGCAKRNQWHLVKYVLLVPFYWLMISIAGAIALYQLIFRPHYWEKTVHGFHLQKAKTSLAEITVATLEREQQILPIPVYRRFANLILSKKAYIGGASLIVASVVANFLNFAFNAYLGRVLDLANFGLVSLVSSFLYFTQIPYSAIGSTVNYRSGFLEGRFGTQDAQAFWAWVRKRSLYISIVFLGAWIAAAPFLMNYFLANSMLPFLMFAPVWVFGMIAAVDRGYIAGKLLFGYLAVVSLVEPITKLLVVYIFEETQLLVFAYTAIPIAIFISFLSSAILANVGKSRLKKEIMEAHVLFPKKFFVASLLSGLSTITFLSLDIILAKHYLSPEDAGRYALVSLVGKMVYFLGSLASQFVMPLVSFNEGAMKNSGKTFFKILGSTYFLTFIGFVAFGVLGFVTVPILFGEKANSIVSYLPLFTFAFVLFSLSRVFVSYYQAKKVYTFSVITFLLAIVQISLISLDHRNIQSLVNAMAITGMLNLSFVILLHVFVAQVRVFENFANDLLSLVFEKAERQRIGENRLRILIFNWRDTRHIWAGGAEGYIHELSKRWVKEGNRVTIFCGNDAHSPRNQVIDGIQIVRRGGQYMVYFWAFLYYMLRFRGKYDVIIDSENGIPFFTPLYAKIPVFLLIHHVHQEVFRKHLVFPLSFIARFMEARLMPLVYKNNTIITVSESSKKEIENLGLAKSGNIEVLHPGIEDSKFYKSQKTNYPSFLYLGRLKPYKNIDIAIRAFAEVVRNQPSAELSIVGEGEMMDRLAGLAARLKVADKVIFYGKISDSDKALLLSQAWVVLQPSLLEGWGITVIEANASGTPVIASNVSGLRDSIVNNQTGVLVPPRNIEAFAGAMRDFIMSKKYREEMSKGAYLWSKNFSWDKSAGNFYHILENGLRKSYLYNAIGKIAFVKKSTK
ncbi:MAG: hypothetical protein ACD_50C00390G0001, partial [uncultured bacterium]